MDETIRCPYCIEGVWYRDNDYKEGYGEPYRPATIPCEVCHGSKAILKSAEKSRPDLETITQEQREEILKKMKK